MPEYLERLLFDDIPYLKEAQAEHDAFAQCLRDAGVEVVYLIDLVVNSLTSPEVRQELVTQFLKEADLPDEAVGKAVAEYLSELDDRAMVSAMMAGIRRSDLRKQGGRLSDHLSGLEEGYPFAVDPMPNLYFTRDPFAVVGEGVNLNRMYSVTRNRETLYGKYVFKYHPDYKDVSLYFRRDCQFHTEGGEGSLLPYGFAQTSGELDAALEKMQAVFADMLELAQVEKSMQLLAQDIEKTRRRVNALEYVMIPETEKNIRYITMKLDENERGNTTRLMKVKDMVLQDAHHYQP